MLLDRVRDETSRAKKNEIQQCELIRKRKLRELYRYTALLEARSPLTPLDLNVEEDPQPDAAELHFLDQNDLSKGRLFRDATLPLPFRHQAQDTQPYVAALTPPEPLTTHHKSIETVDASITGSRVRSISPSGCRPKPSPKPDQHSSITQSTPHRVAFPTELHPGRQTPVSTVSSADASRTVDGENAARDHGNQTSSQGHTQVPANNDTNAPGQSTKSILVTRDQPSEAKEKVVSIKETVKSHTLSPDKERREDDRLATSVMNNATELASSPSSTVGPYSANTPRPTQHSPDTSPEQETFGNDSSFVRRRDPKALPVINTKSQDETASASLLSATGAEGQNSLAPLTPADSKQLQDEQANSAFASNRSPSGNDISHDILTDNVDNHSDIRIHSGISNKSMLDLDSELRKQPTPPPDLDMPDASSPTVSKEPRTARHSLDNGSTPRPTLTKPRISESHDKPPVQSTLTPDSSAVVSKSNVQNLEPQRKDERKKPKQSAVIFPKKNGDAFQNAMQLYSEEYAALKGASLDDRKDYLLGLFTHQAHLTPRSTPLDQLLSTAHKAVSTTNYSAWLRDYQDYKILKRVYQLQNANRWSLRQIEKAPEPARPITHDDFLLAEMKWMRTDFKEERKWKHSMARTLAEWCAEYVTSSPERRLSLRVKVAATHAAKLDASENGSDAMVDVSTPDLIASGSVHTEGESVDDEYRPATPNFGTNASSLFSLGFDDVLLQLDYNPANERLLGELPEYDHNAKLFQDEFGPIEPTILPVSKFVTGKIVTKSTGPPRKRSRFDYDQEEDLSDYPSKRATPEHSRPSTPGRRLHRDDLPPEKNDVALFHYENKHVRDRLHASHVFRPPSEFPMPSVSFLASRASSQWHWDEDQKLRSLVKEYQFNWSLISSELAIPSLFTAGAERRTPWECFERWVQLEGLPAEMSKTQYFRTYQSRLEEAQRIVTSNYQVAQQLAAQQGQAAQSMAPRRRTAQPFRVERRKTNRYLTMIDAMRKLARKRESAAHKQQEAAKAAALRKAHEPVAPKSTVHTPQEFSKLKYERDQQQERREAIRQQQQQQLLMAQRQNANLQRVANASHNGNGQATQARAMPTPTSGTANTNGSPGSQVVNAASTANMQGRPNSAQAMMQNNGPNGTNMAGMGMGVNGMPQAQMQMPSQQRTHGSQENLRLAMQQRQLQVSQQQQQQYQLQQQLNNTTNLANAHLAGTNMAMQSPNMVAGMTKQMNGNGNGSMNGVSRSLGSPQMNMTAAAAANQGRLSNGVMPAINSFQSAIQQAHPDWPREQVVKAAQEKLATHLRQQQQQQQQRQSAINAAAGNVYQANGNMMGSASPNNVQHFNQQAYLQNMMRNTAQGQLQPQASSPNMSSARPVSRSATPQNPQQQQQLQQSPGMQQAQMARN